MVIMIPTRMVVFWMLWAIFLYQTCYYRLVVAGDGGSTATTTTADTTDGADAAWSFFEQGNEVNPIDPSLSHLNTPSLSLTR